MGTATAMAPIKRVASGRKASTLRSIYKDDRSVRAAMLEDLKKSGFAPKDADTLHLSPYTATEVSKRYASLPKHRAGYHIPYFDIKGRTTKFFRFRYLEYGEADAGFAGLVAETAKKLRYAQPHNTVNELYLPPFVDWQAVAKDTSKAIMITEGEKKAACATKHGIPTIGLGGVWCFKSNNQRMPLLPMFAEIEWKDRPVYIVYDSDAVTNPQVMSAENALARELLMRYRCVPFVGRIPIPRNGAAKYGVDDYIVEFGTEQFEHDVLEEATEWKAAEELYKLNEEVVYVQDPGIVLKLENLQRMTPRAFFEHAYAPRIYYEEQITANGTKTTERSAAKEWLKWKHRATVRRVTYVPGAGRTTEDGCLNVWRGWGVQPEAGDVKPWQRLLDFLFQGCPTADRKWFEQWLAYPLQHPAEKLYSAVVLWGIHHGTGKSLVGYTMFKIYGENATEIGDRDLYSAHNEWAEHKQFVMGDEITGGDKRGNADRMKSMITQKLLRLNPKYVPSYTVPDCINYFFTSNHPDAFFLEDTDRRFFIHEVATRPMENEFYKTYMQWLNNGGASALFHYFLTLDCTDFDPQGHAPVTASKKEMIADGRSDVGTWVANLRENPDQVLVVAGRQVPYKLWTTSELFSLYDPNGTSRVTASGIGRELRRGGFTRAWNGQPIKTQTAGMQRLWLIRDVAKLESMKYTELAALFDKERGGKNATAKKF